MTKQQYNKIMNLWMTNKISRSQRNDIHNLRDNSVAWHDIYDMTWLSGKKVRDEAYNHPTNRQVEG